MNIDDVQQFLNQHETCVIATIGDSWQPEAATVGFSLDDGFKVMIATNQKTRKAQNLAVNSRVALVVGFTGPRTLQLEGEAEKVDPKEYEERINLHFEKVPAAKKFSGESGQNYYLITPSWLRFTDYTKKSPVFEIKDFS